MLISYVIFSPDSTRDTDHFALFGQLNKIRGRKEKAKRSFEEAIRICKGDKNWNRLKAPSDPSIEDIITMIKKEKDTLDC